MGEGSGNKNDCKKNTPTENTTTPMMRSAEMIRNEVIVSKRGSPSSREKVGRNRKETE
jgi:hypothetical protein